ncbi:MAG TPA: carbon-nitrogen hydrolase family protein [Acidiphilium sp.]|nr:MAG: nitrilase [Acidiphilium sp. 21-60-14]HQT87665.1 carbon-nitrogen hydrolase family protein [Acidiphilium sp.]HQU22792.1 carbon-nitrogen hydrolase family protein [Acidiphilium sp.]
MSQRIAISQTAGCFANPQASLDLLEHQARAARAQGADLLLLPEMFLSGYNLGAEICAALAITPHDPLFDQLRSIASRHAIALCLGYPERVGAGVANSAALIDAAGHLRLNHRKVHLYGALDRAMFSHQGDRFAVVDWCGWRVGLAICYDIEFPESARLMALAGADLLLVPTALMTPYDVVANHVVRARAYENQVFLAYANHCGSEQNLDYLGLSSIIAPDGSVLAQAGTSEGQIFASIDPARQADLRARDPLLADRRPALYRPIHSAGSDQS